MTTTYDYTYDARNRLRDVKQNGVLVASYWYDVNGNRTEYGGIYDPQDRLIFIPSPTWRGFSYTSNGELSVDGGVLSGIRKKYGYDVFGNLKRASQVNVSAPDVVLPGVIEYLVDARNRRVGKKKDGVLVKQWLYRDQLHPVAELDGAGNLVSRFVYVTGKNSPDYMIQGSTFYRILSDHLGSPRLVVNTANNAVVQRMRHDAFGNVLEDTNPGFTPFGFAGGLYDPDTRLVRFGARDYDPSVGRWTNKDPIRFDGGQANLYVYVNDDPVNYSDPRGLWYVDINVTGGFWLGVTAGVFYDGTTGSWHPYVGAGGTTPGVGVSANFSNGSVSPGMSSGQLACGVNSPLGFGVDGAVGTDATGAPFWEGGVSLGTPGPSVSGLGYYTW